MKAYTQKLAAIVLLVMGLISCQSETKQKNEITLGLQTYSFRTMEDQSHQTIPERTPYGRRKSHCC
jgi:hypothetical protein